MDRLREVHERIEDSHVFTKLCPDCAEKLNRMYFLNPHKNSGDRLKRCELCKRIGYFLDYDYHTASYGRGKK